MCGGLEDLEKKGDELRTPDEFGLQSNVNKRFRQGRRSMANTMQVELVWSSVDLVGEATAVYCPDAEGENRQLAGQHPIGCARPVGWLRFSKRRVEAEKWRLHGGSFRSGGRVRYWAEIAESADEIDVARAHRRTQRAGPVRYDSTVLPVTARSPAARAENGSDDSHSSCRFGAGGGQLTEAQRDDCRDTAHRRRRASLRPAVIAMGAGGHSTQRRMCPLTAGLP